MVDEEFLLKEIAGHNEAIKETIRAETRIYQIIAVIYAVLIIFSWFKDGFIAAFIALILYGIVGFFIVRFFHRSAQESIANQERERGARMRQLDRIIDKRRDGK